MARYHKQNFGPSFEAYPRRSGEPDRRGAFPYPETPQERARRLWEKGYAIQPVAPPTPEAHALSQHDLGNKALPAYQKKAEITAAIENNRISMLVGPTGSGKTTQLGQYMLERGYKVVFLVPRRVIANNIGERVEEELTEQLGVERAQGMVGISHSERNTVTDDSQILVMTSGTFSRRLPDLSKRWQGEKVVVVADEIHEGNLETDIATALAVKQVEQDDAWRMVLASATPDIDAVTTAYEQVNGAPVPVTEIKGRPHHLEMVEAPDEDIVDAYLSHSAGVQKALIFVDGKRSIKEAITKLRAAMTPEERSYTRFFKLHADISEKDRRDIFTMQLAPGEKAVIVSTSAGQSGITVPGVNLVITSGLTKSPELDNEYAPGLPVRHCTQAEIIQQAGRAGRDVSGGVCVLARPLGYELYRNRDNPLYDFIPLEERSPHIPPEIYHSNIARNVLRGAVLGYDFGELNDYLLHSVTPRTIIDAYEVLATLGAVDDTNKVTELGTLMDEYPLRPELARTIAEVVRQAKDINLQVYALAIAAAIEAGGLIDFDQGNGDWKAHVRQTTQDDFIGQLDLMMASRRHYHRWPRRSNEQEEQYIDLDGMQAQVDEGALTRMGLHPRRTLRAHRAFDKMCRLAGLQRRDVVFVDPKETEEQELRDLFLLGMPELIYQKVATRQGIGQFENVHRLDDSVRREMSRRSMMSSMGRTACGLVAGYPRWYEDGHGRQHSIIEQAFPVSREQLRRVLGNLATRDAKVELRGDRLVGSGLLRLGSLDLGAMKVVPYPATTPEQRWLIVDGAFRAKSPAVQALLRTGLPPEKVRKICFNKAAGVSEVGELTARLWSELARYQ